LDGVILTPLKQIYNPKGDIFHAMKKTDVGFCEFGEAYFSTIKCGDIKGWKKHSEMTLNIIVIAGEIEFVVYDENSKDFYSVKLSQDNYQRLTVAAGLWMAFRGASEENMLLNIASIEHNPSEAINIDLSEINYEW
jgi:dTDP-4-dehydrorhamnose 3,5-epimerase